MAFSCSEPARVEEEVILPLEEAPKEEDLSSNIPRYKFEFSSLSLNQNVKDLDHFVFKHFGEFYTEDFNVYRLDRLDYLAEASEIDNINLYYIDSLLVKIQVYMREDMTDKFLRRYGSAKISINDYHNKKLLETEEVLVKNNGKYQVNEKLDAFTLKWIRDDLDIEYNVSRKPDSLLLVLGLEEKNVESKSNNFQITFQTKDFENQLAWVKWKSYQESKQANSRNKR